MNKTYIPTLILLVILAVLHYYASKYHLYYKISWFDIVMHVTGGIALALSAYWVTVTFFKKPNPSFILIIFITLVLGFAWEYLEYFYDIGGAPVGTLAYYVDSSKDLLDDILGAIIACLFLKIK